MNAVILSVGSEILAGQLTDTNSQYFAQELTQLGIDVAMILQLPDDQTRIVWALEQAASIAEVIILSGGLGPTADDLTREAIAEWVGEVPHVDSALLEEIRNVFASRGQTMPERNAKQAWLVDSAVPIHNLNGTAPGWIVTRPTATIVALPGPPRENRRMWLGPVLDLLRPTLGARVIQSRTLKTIGIGESSVEDALEDIVNAPSPLTATYAKSDGVHIRITATGDDHEAVTRSIDDTVREIQNRLGNHIYGADGDPLAGAVASGLTQRRRTLSIFEVATAGTVSNLLMSDAAAARVVRAAIVQPDLDSSRYPDPLAETLACATTLANQSRQHFATDWGLGVVAVPYDAGQGQRVNASVGIVLSSGTETVSDLRSIYAYPEEVRRRAMLWSAELLWSQFGKHVSITGAEAASS